VALFPSGTEFPEGGGIDGLLGGEKAVEVHD
jgi:hypothetical protein